MDSHSGFLSGVLASSSITYNSFSTQQYEVSWKHTHRITLALLLKAIQRLPIKLNSACTALVDQSLPTSVFPSLFLCLHSYHSGLHFIQTTQQAYSQLQISLACSSPRFSCARCSGILGLQFIRHLLRTSLATKPLHNHHSHITHQHFTLVIFFRALPTI